MITVIFFANLKSITGRDKIELSMKEYIDIQHVIEKLSIQFDNIGRLIKEKRIMIAVNQEMADYTTVIKDGDEVALMPPFSGGSI